jgi:hypothetical protein
MACSNEIQMMSINAPDVSLTDFFIALTCLYFALRLMGMQAMHHDLRKLFVGLFLFTALGAGAGGAYHGFFEVETSIWTKISWTTTLLAIGCTAFYVWHLAVYFLLPQSWRRFTAIFLQLGIFGYAYYVGVVSQNFIVAIIAYLPAVILLLIGLLVRLFKTKDSRMFLGVFGLLLTIAAAGVQVERIGLHPQYFNHNALYHLIQIIGLYFIYRFAVRVVVWN